jgi:GMP synthase (glutamine-hydrolysing)
MGRTALALRHVHFEDVGAYAEPLEAAGYRLAYRDATAGDIAEVDAAAADLLIVLGGPIGAYQEAEYPFLGGVLRLLGRRLDADRPTLGICLGAQLMARVLGADVAPGPRPEIGWAPVSLTPAGMAGPTRHLADTALLHWHGDVAGLPDGAACLAHTASCGNQAFAVGPNLLGLQFHAEVEEAGFERWLVGHAHEVATTDGVSVPRLRDDAARLGPAAVAAGRKCIASWLEGLTR